MDNIEKIAEIIYKRRGVLMSAMPIAREILQALLSDPDTHIIEYDPDAELPEALYDKDENLDPAWVEEATKQDMLDAGWVKKEKKLDK